MHRSSYYEVRNWFDEHRIRIVAGTAAHLAGGARHGAQRLAAGQPAILLDEAGAVLVFPAATATWRQLHFAIRYSSGLIHAAMPTSRLDQLRVPDQPVLASENSGTSFTVSVDATTGIGTGISAYDRAHTMRVLADPMRFPMI